MNLVKSVKAIVSSKTKWGHLLFFLVIEVVAAALVYIFIIPLVFWSLYGEGAASDRIGSLPVSIFISELGAFIIILLPCAIGFTLNVRRHDLRRAKSHLLTALIVTGLYLLRAPLLLIMFEM